jgi:hypothetical protein
VIDIFIIITLFITLYLFQFDFHSLKIRLLPYIKAKNVWRFGVNRDTDLIKKILFSYVHFIKVFL